MASEFHKWAGQLMAHMEKTAGPRPEEKRYVTQQAKAPVATPAPPKPSTGAAAPDYADRISWMADTAVNNGLAPKEWGTQLRRKAISGMNKARQNIRPETERGLFTSNMFINPTEFDDYKRRFDAVRQDPWANPDETAEVFGYMEKAMPEEEFRNATSAIKWSLPTSIAAGATGNLLGAQDALERQQQTARNYIGDGTAMNLMHLSNFGGEALGAYYGGKALRAVGAGVGIPNLSSAVAYGAPKTGLVAGTASRVLSAAGSKAVTGMAIAGHALDETGKAMGPAYDKNGDITAAGVVRGAGGFFRNMPSYAAVGALVPGGGVAAKIGQTATTAGFYGVKSLLESAVKGLDAKAQESNPAYSALRGYGDVQKTDNDVLAAIQEALAFMPENAGKSGDQLRAMAEKTLAESKTKQVAAVNAAIDAEPDMTPEQREAEKQKNRQAVAQSSTILDPAMLSDPTLTPEQRSDLAKRHMKFLVSGNMDAGDFLTAGWHMTLGDGAQVAEDKMLQRALQRDPAVAKGVQNIVSGYLDLNVSPEYKAEGGGMDADTVRQLGSIVKHSTPEQIDSYFSRLDGYTDDQMNTLLANLAKQQSDGAGLLDDPKVFKALSKRITARMDRPESMAKLLPTALKLSSAANGGLSDKYMKLVSENLEKMDFDQVYEKMDGNHFFDVLQLMQSENGEGAKRLKSALGEERYKKLEEKVIGSSKSAIAGKLIQNPALFNRAAGVWLTSMGFGEAGKWVNDNPEWFYGGLAALLGLGGLLLFGGGSDKDENRRTPQGPAYIDQSRLANALPY